MRIGRRIRRKAIDTRHVNMLSSDSAFVQSAKALTKAQEIAEYNKDIDAIVAISDRWAMLARALDADESQAARIPIGFSADKDDKDEHNS